MIVRRIFFIALLTICGFWGTDSFAEIVSQKDKLFTIDIPNGWVWIENQPGLALIKAPDKINTIAIEFTLQSFPSSKAAVDSFRKFNQELIKSVITPIKGVVVLEKERLIDGVYARQLEFAWVTRSGARVHTANIRFANKGYLFVIAFTTDSVDVMRKMGKIVATLKLK